MEERIIHSFIRKDEAASLTYLGAPVHYLQFTFAESPSSGRWDYLGDPKYAEKFFFVLIKQYDGWSATLVSELHIRAYLESKQVPLQERWRPYWFEEDGYLRALAFEKKRVQDVALFENQSYSLESTKDDAARADGGKGDKDVIQAALDEIFRKN
jgi:hypothetical protein